MRLRLVLLCSLCLTLAGFAIPPGFTADKMHLRGTKSLACLPAEK